MKTIITIILFLVIAGLSLTVYRSGNSTINEVSVLRDVTDRQLSQPQAGEIIPLFALNSHLWNGGIFRFANITDVSYMPAQEVCIGTANQWLSNRYDREKTIKGFTSQVTQILANTQHDSIGKMHSSVYMPIASELNRLSRSKSSRRILLVYSDLMENDVDYSFYNCKTLSQLKSNYALASLKFNQMMPLQNLVGIEVHLLYQPPTVESDGQYRIVSTFYQRLLESKGATVTISANFMH
jgi:hypothetical protein